MSEKKKKVFISGPMSGIKDFNKPAFDQAEEYLTKAGYSVFNPARMHFDDSWTHEEIMRIDLAALTQCDYILMLPKWCYSKGSIQEYNYANAIGIEVMSARDMEPPKKEEKPKPRIEIETFGDISEKNINMLMMVERHYSELLATGGTITQVKITCEPKLEAKPTPDTPKKSCQRCKYRKNYMYEEPCKSCDIDHTKWEPMPDAPKTCGTCKYNNGSKPSRPCSDCGLFKNWEPAPTKLCSNCKSHYEDSLDLCKSCNDKSNWTPKDA